MHQTRECSLQIELANASHTVSEGVAMHFAICRQGAELCKSSFYFRDATPV